MPQFKVPQNLDMEDRIVGKFTLIQFGYLALGGLIAYLALIKIGGFFGILFAGIIGIFAFALAAIRVHGESMPKFLSSLFKYVMTPKEQGWSQDRSNQKPLIREDKPVVKNKGQKAKKNYSKQDLENIAEVVDSHGYSELDNE